MEFRIQNGGRLQPLDPQPALIDRTYERLVAAIADGTLAPGQRIRQEELGRALGVSRQPISHALQLLKQQKLVEEHGRRGLIVSEIDAARVRELYQVRSAALSHGSTARRTAPAHQHSCEANVLGPPKLEHAVQRHHSNGHLGRLPPLGPRPQRVTDHSLVAADIGFHQGTPIVT
jgi:DNA-binding transcriptional MocR family regulator